MSWKIIQKTDTALLHHLQFKNTLFHKIACETNAGLKQNRLSLVKGKGALSLVDVGAMEY